MKEVKEVQTRTDIHYCCEICGKKDSNKDRIEKCELSHTCSHTNKSYEFKECYDVNGYDTIEWSCNTCDHYENYDYYDLSQAFSDSDTVGKIFNIIQEYSRQKKK